jgi:hypothetical protein
MEKFTCDFNRFDLGELIEMVRLKMELSSDGFSSLLGIKTATLMNAEDGLNTSVYLVLDKMIKHHKVSNYFSIQVEFKI